jgi:hypothetical protein
MSYLTVGVGMALGFALAGFFVGDTLSEWWTATFFSAAGLFSHWLLIGRKEQQ